MRHEADTPSKLNCTSENEKPESEMFISDVVRDGPETHQRARLKFHALPPKTVYAHLLADDHSDAMAALGAMEAEPGCGPNVVPLWG